MHVVRNKRLGQLPTYGPCPCSPTPPAPEHTNDRRRAAGDSYGAAARNLTNRGLGMLHHCLQTRQHYNENKAASNITATSGSPRATKASQEIEAPTTEAVA
jgi:hypothetical protein